MSYYNLEEDLEVYQLAERFCSAVWVIDVRGYFRTKILVELSLSLSYYCSDLSVLCPGYTGSSVPRSALFSLPALLLSWKWYRSTCWLITSHDPISWVADLGRIRIPLALHRRTTLCCCCCWERGDSIFGKDPFTYNKPTSVQKTFRPWYTSKSSRCSKS